MTGLRNYNKDWAGFITLTDRRTVHVKTIRGGYDKVILTYRYECENCDYTVTRDGLPGLDRTALKHVKQVHGLKPWKD